MAGRGIDLRQIVRDRIYVSLSPRRNQRLPARAPAPVERPGTQKAKTRQKASKAASNLVLPDRAGRKSLADTSFAWKQAIAPYVDEIIVLDTGCAG